jgi:hypothetical protein
MDQLMMSFVVALSLLLQFAAQVLAVVVALWIWNHWPAVVARTKRTSG